MSAHAVWALEIVPNDQAVDPHTRALAQILHDLGRRHPGVTHGRLYLISGEQSPQLQQLVRNLCLDPVIAEARSGTRSHADEGWLIEILPHPGVTDAEGDSLAEALTRDGIPGIRVRAGHRYHIADALDATTVATAARHLAHDVVERVSWRPATCPPDESWWDAAFMPDAAPDRTVATIAIRALDPSALQELSARMLLSLPRQDLVAIGDYFESIGRDPTDVELETIAQTWSEHCAHRTFKATIRHREPGADDLEIHGLLKTYIMAATDAVNRPWVLSAFRDNAGVIAFDRNHEVSFKVETHNHPSALEPFGGANTGVGGVVRDVLGVSAEPIANTDVLCFGPLDTSAAALPPGTLPPQRVYDGVVAGIADYGNKMGIPTVNGATLFDPGYVANPLVFCGTVGLAPRGLRPTEPCPGDLIVVTGGRAGRDGIHGATFSSDVLGTSHAELGSVVQIGDPIVEKRLADALPRARDLGLYSAITDCGAGGLSSAVGEMASVLGAEVELDRVPLKYDGLRPWEIWLSEAQERMVLAVPPHHWPALHDVFAAEGVEATSIGRFTGDGQLRVRYDEQIVADLDCAFLHDGMPIRQLESVWPTPSPIYSSIAPETDLTRLLERALSDPNVASKEPIVRHYDHEVQGRTVGKPFVGPFDIGAADAAVMRPVARSWRGLAVGCGINPWYGEIDPYAMALLAIDEAMRNVVVVGADPARTALLDNFCWGNPMLPDRLGGLVRAAQGCHDAAVAFRVPFISGKDSLFNEYRLADGTSRPIPGTLLISAIGIVPDIRRTVSMFLKRPGNLLYLIGLTGDDLGGSLALRLAGQRGSRAPVVNLATARRTLSAIHRATRKGLLQSCHDLSDGGLAVAAAEMAIGGGFGLEIDLRNVSTATCHSEPAGEESRLLRTDTGAGRDSSFLGMTHQGLSDATLLFAESPTRFLVEVAQEDAATFEAILGKTPHARIGVVLAQPQFRATSDRGTVIDADITRLRTCWLTPLAEAAV
ncbi:MAG: phosphoribosylformylglycinamidine synthase subunit PurL [Chloroflexia bacterium]|nr:phosphoribosylformylglycinamidine synthase subunit PurL [Chloroflexia bacterium]